MIENIQWHGHGSFMIQGPPLIYINPWRLTRTTFLADAILISHDHFEHFSVADVQKLRGPETLILTNERVAAQLEGATVLHPWQSITVDRARITAIPAYSLTDPRHARAHGGLGFLISLNFYDIYYAGDTEHIPEMDILHPDIALLPIDGDGTLTVADAVEVVRQMRPRYVMPYNWGEGVAGAALHDAQAFKTGVGERSEVVIRE